MSELAIDGVVDLECFQWTQYLACGVLTATGEYRSWSVWEDGDGAERSAVEHLLSLRGTYWAHGGRGYDWLWLLEWCRRLGVPASASLTEGGQPTRVTIGALTLLDSAALVPGRLADLAPGAKKSLPAVCECGADCGGWCAVRPGMTGWRSLLEYLRADCDALLGLLLRLRSWAAEEGIVLRSTLGATAYATADEWLGLPPVTSDRGQHLYLRSAYHGARCQLLRPHSTRGYESDRRWAYVASLSTSPLPWGEARWRHGPQARAAYAAGLEGVYSARVEIPECHLPPLPYRQPDGRVSYPWGTIEGRWAAPELRAAEARGCRVRVTRGLVYRESRSDFFAPWAARLWELRQQTSGDHLLGPWVKTLGNALTGKFGVRPVATALRLNPSGVRGCRCSRSERRERRGQCTGRCGSMRALSDDAYSQSRYEIAASAAPAWASYVNAVNRVAWLDRALYSGDGWDCVYGDTDSLLSEGPRPVVADAEPGEWRLVGEYSDFRGLAPKRYSRCLGGRQRVKASGLKLRQNHLAEDWESLESGQLHQPASPLGIRAGARKGSIFDVRPARTHHLERSYGDRWLDSSAGVTRAPEVRCP